MPNRLLPLLEGHPVNLYHTVSLLFNFHTSLLTFVMLEALNLNRCTKNGEGMGIEHRD